MCSGLSGILDTSDNSSNSQKASFTSDKWEEITSNYSSFKDSFIRSQLESNLESVYHTWTVIYKSSSTESSFFKARKLFNRLSCEDDITEHKFKQLQVVDFFLDAFDNKQFIIAPKDAANLTERDYESQIWVPLFTKLFAIQKVFLVKIKAGESVSDESTKKKSKQYATSKT